jgi:rhamnogalacturonan endolyase
VQKGINTLFSNDFTDFAIGPFPYDPEHSAMGEYHYYPAKGYAGQWYDPITGSQFRGPTWLVTEDNGTKFMEQMRIGAPGKNVSCPTLVAGDKDWEDYTATVKMRTFYTKEPAGLLFRYQTSLMHYAFMLYDKKAQLYLVEKDNRTLLNEVDFDFNCDTIYELKAEVCGDLIKCYIDGKLVIETNNDRYQYGCIAIAAYMPAQFTDVNVVCDDIAYDNYYRKIKAKEKRVAEKRLKYPQPKLVKVIDLKNYGAGRQLRFGHLTGTDEWFFVIAQHQKRVFKDRYAVISCLTAVSLDTGEILWQIGEPSNQMDNLYLTADLPFQVYDIDGDGVDEVIMARNFELMILDGKTGKVRKSIPTPINEEPAEELCGIEFKKHGFERLNVDSIRIVNVSGNDRPSDIMIKDRYSRLWVYDCDLNFKWKFSHNNTGHFPYSHDFNGDGKDEILSCYNMVSSEGELVWELPINTDHVDEIICGKMDPDQDELIALVAGWEGFMIIDKQGNILVRDINGHGQRISTGNYCPDIRGMQICTTTYWGNQGIIYLYDCKGNEIWHMEPSSNGNIIAPVNWMGDGTELILLNGNIKYGGMLDGEGDRVVVFPDDGHPDLCAEVIDLWGDARDEIVLWDENKMYIYTQDRPCEITDKEYIPEKYPHCNFSNYRGEFSYPRWREKDSK